MGEAQGRHQATRHFAANANKPPEKWSKWSAGSAESGREDEPETAGDGDGNEDDDGVGHSATFDT